MVDFNNSFFNEDFYIEYNLHKDGSLVADSFKIKEDAEKHYIKLVKDGYKPRRKYRKVLK